MNDQDSDELDLVLTAGTTSRSTTDRDRVFAAVWARVEESMHDHTADDAEVLQFRRLDVLADREKAARRRRRVTKLASVTLAVVVAGGGTAAAAEYLSTHTGAELTGWERAAAGSGEILNLGGTDRDQVFDQVTADIPFAPGYEAARQWLIDSFPRESDSAISTQLLRADFASNAVCTWADAWVAADTAGDTARRDEATATLVEAQSWPDIVDNDLPEASVLPSGELVSRNYFVRPLASSADAGDHQGVLDAVAGSHACNYQVIPVIDADQGYAYHGVR